MFKSLKRTALLSLVLVLFVSALALTAGASSAKAQTGGTKTTCDSTTVLLTYLAQNLGFHSTALDINTFELGQYQSYFDTMHAGAAGQGGQTSAGQAGQSDNAAGQAGQTDQSGNAAGQAGQTDQSGNAAGQAGQTDQSGNAAGQAGQTDQSGAASTIVLMPATVANEDPMCTQLRSEVESFLFGELQAGRLGMDRFGMSAQGQMGTGGQSSTGSAGQSDQSGQSDMMATQEATEAASGGNG